MRKICASPYGQGAWVGFWRKWVVLTPDTQVGGRCVWKVINHLLSGNFFATGVDPNAYGEKTYPDRHMKFGMVFIVIP